MQEHSGGEQKQNGCLEVEELVGLELANILKVRGEVIGVEGVERVETGGVNVEEGKANAEEQRIDEGSLEPKSSGKGPWESAGGKGHEKIVEGKEEQGDEGEIHYIVI